MKLLAVLFLGLTFLSQSAQAVVVEARSLRDGDETVALWVDKCPQLPKCSSESILPPSLRVGNMSTCVSPTLQNARLEINDLTYYMYEYENKCQAVVNVYVRLGNMWVDADSLGRPGKARLRVSYLVPGETVSPPSAIMFCKAPGEPMGDTACK